MLFRENLLEILNYYENLYSSYSRILEKGPPGGLLWQENHGKDQFLHYKNVDGRRYRKVITRNVDLQKALAQKEFARRSLGVLRPNIEMLRNIIDNMEPFDPNQILQSMNKGYHRLPDSFFFDRIDITTKLHLDEETKARIERHRDWGNQPYTQSTFMEEYKINRTTRGVLVRSKSEVLILETLYRFHDIPHRYEQEQIIGNITIAPDLTFEEYSGDLFYWEHLGMMDVSEYAERNFRKLRTYYDVGLVPGDNLILSFDRQGKIDMSYIESIIKYQVIPRL